MYGCEHSTIKKAEHWKVDAFELWYWTRLWRVLWTARRSNQSNLKEVSPEYSLEGLMLKLKREYFGHLMWADSFEKTLMLEKIEGGRKRGWQRIRWLDGITDLMDMSLSKLWELMTERKSGVLQSMGSQRVGHDRAELNWTELNWFIYPWDSPGKNTGMCCRSNPSSRESSWPKDQTQVSCLLLWQEDSLPLVPPGKPPVRIATIKKTADNKRWVGYGETETLITVDGAVNWLSKYGKWYGASLKKLNIELPFLLFSQ